jgi:alpha-beta hydrolase superfamily lysophospholipase
MAARITAPTLVITGRQDRLVDVRVSPAVAKLIPDSRLMVLDQTGHVAQMERPEIVARAVLAMLDEVRDSQAVSATMDETGGPGIPLADGRGTPLTGGPGTSRIA